MSFAEEKHDKIQSLSAQWFELQIYNDRNVLLTLNM